jgi:hypothetical protein
MKKTMRLTAIALTLFILVSCGGVGDGKAVIRANGTAGDSKGLISARMLVNNNDVTEQLTNIADTSGANQEFTATVQVDTSMVDLSASPKEGFVLDEWVIDYETARADYRAGVLSEDDFRALRKELDERHEETITVKASLAKYFIATFDRGYYVKAGAAADGTGAKDKPFATIEAALNAKTEDDEMTIKLSGSFPELALNDELMVEELKLIGGFDANWKYDSSQKSKIKSITTASTDDKEIEICGVIIETLTINGSAELELMDVEIGTVNATGNAVVGNAIIDNITIAEGKKLIVANSVVKEYNAGATYYHSLVFSTSENFAATGFKGRNNILGSNAGDTVPAGNIKFTDASAFTSMDIIEDAPGFNEATLIDEDSVAEEAEDYIEEDMFGHDRDECKKVAFGPIAFF